MINDQYEFISDHEFSSPSGAAVAVGKESKWMERMEVFGWTQC